DAARAPELEEDHRLARAIVEQRGVEVEHHHRARAARAGAFERTFEDGGIELANGGLGPHPLKLFRGRPAVEAKMAAHRRDGEVTRRRLRSRMRVSGSPGRPRLPPRP